MGRMAAKMYIQLSKRALRLAMHERKSAIIATT
jgi:hypothetical protein